MSDQYIEKSFLYLVALSILVHIAVFSLIYFMPEKKHAVKQEPYFVELEDLPQLKDLQAGQDKKTERQSAKRSRVRKETAPKGDMSRERVATLPRTIPVPPPQPALPRRQNNVEGGFSQERGTDAMRKTSPGKDLLRDKRRNLPELAKLYPSASGLAGLEESYRKKYGHEVEEGETKFLNTDDILFGSFLRRFETAVYGVWRYPADAARQGIEGVTPVKITFNRKGEVENVELLETSGSKILDDEVFRALRMIGPIGSFPKGYDKDKFNLIAFFQYGIIRGTSRGMLH